MFLVTVMHTGTTSLKKQHPDCEHRHCDETALARVKSGEQTLTTYRDPDKVVESWLNRGWFEHEKFKKMWYSQWEHYAALANMDNVEVIQMKDLEHHLNHVEEADNEGYFLNNDMINYAHECSAWSKQ